MCGIVGIVTEKDELRASLQEIAIEAALAIKHRGPNDSGVWTDPSGRVALSHRRLSIIDLSTQGKQPMVSRSGRFVIVFNGEIYNFLSLRRELTDAGVGFRGSSDSEVLLAGIEHWGVSNTLQRIGGMFAIALWDNSEQKLFLIRDRMGKKPLYYSWGEGTMIFASELKSLQAVPGFNPPISLDALDSLFRFGYIASPFSIYRGVYKLPPGTILELSLSALLAGPPESFSPHPSSESSLSLSPVPYWSVGDLLDSRLRLRKQLTYGEAVYQTRELLKDAVSKRLTADVPLGAFLSGGIDSSLVVAMMQQLKGKTQTFSISFPEGDYDEGPFALEVAKQLGTEHHQLSLTAGDALSIIGELPHVYDEPFADSSQVPTLLLSRFTRQHVTVALSGDGGDELFLGYNRYIWPEAIWSRLSYIPQALRPFCALVLGAASNRHLANSSERILNSLLPEKLRVNRVSDKLHRLRNGINSKSVHELYESLITLWPNSPLHSPPTRPPLEILSRSARVATGSSPLKFAELAALQDLALYLPDDNLVKVDRASMAASLEVRCPFLDHRLASLATSFSEELRIPNREPKAILKTILQDFLPSNLINRPKMGFSVPIRSWLRGELKDWASDLLSASNLQSSGLLEAKPIIRYWREHLSGSRDWSATLWSVLMFQQWLKHSKKTNH